jgi:hypothetical protein
MSELAIRSRTLTSRSGYWRRIAAGCEALCRQRATADPSEQLLRALLLQAFSTIRSERTQSREGAQIVARRALLGGRHADSSVGIDEEFRVKDGSSEPPDLGHNGEQLRGEKRSNATYASTTDPEAELHRKGTGKEAKLSFLGR